MVEIDDAAVTIAGALEDAGVPYALGGALAYIVHAIPRATNDIDLNVFVPMDDTRHALEVLRAAGVELDVDSAVEIAAARGDGRGRFREIRVDLFFNSIPLHEHALARRQRVTLRGRSVWVLSAEDLVVLKLLFNRGKDHLDVERLLAIQGGRFDIKYTRGQLVAHIGEDDERVERLDALWARWGTASS